MDRTSIVSIAAAVMIWPAVATAAPPQLKGTYAFSGMGSCLYSGDQFISNASGLHPVVWPGFSTFPPGTGNGIFTSNFSVEGLRTFNGDGTGMVTGTSVEIVGPPSLNPRVTVETFTANFTYTPDPNGGFDIVQTQMTSKTASNGDIVSTDKVSFYGLAANNNAALTAASVTANVETQTSVNFDFLTATQTGGEPIDVRYRVCARARSLVWQGN